MKIAIIGSGNVGSALGRRIANGGDAVVFGVRGSAGEAQVPSGTTAAPVVDAAANADVVLLAVPAGAAVDAVRSAGGLAGKVVVDCTNPLRFDRGPIWTPPAEGSVAQALAAACPDARVVKGFNHFGAEIHADPTVAGTRADALFASDDDGAKRIVMDLASRIGFHAVDAGPLRNAALLENLAVLWIHLSMSGSSGAAGRHFAFRIVGREAAPA